MKAIIIQCTKTLALAVVGILMVKASLVWLGMGRHGSTGWGFLHLDWIFQPHLNYWGAHMRNLFWLVLGVFLCLWSVKSLYKGVLLLKDDSFGEKRGLVE